jgi:hypothetical protein
MMNRISIIEDTFNTNDLIDDNSIQLDNTSEDESVNINKGTGAGGENTNKNGLSYEELTDLETHYKIVLKSSDYNVIKFNNSETIFIQANKTKLHKYMKYRQEFNHSVEIGHGCKQPDECYINDDSKTIFIIEKKFQQRSGSVCEKLQTAHFKLLNFKELFPTYKVYYIYCLSDWFKTNCKREIKYLQEINVPVFWGNDSEYKKNIIQFILQN